MDFQTILLIALALLPAAALMIYIYKMDRFEKEPIGLLVGLFFLGVGSVIPAIILERLIGVLINLMFFGTTNTAYAYFSSEFQYYSYYFVDNFIGVALIEECCKWFFMFLITRKNKNFDCLFDGVVYAVFVSLGFAAAENILYVLENGFGNALMRMVTAVPAHCFFAVFMGYYYSRWHINSKAGALEKHLRDTGIIAAGENSFKAPGMLVLSIAVPTVAHGFYDFCATVDSWVFTILFFLFLGFMYFLCFRNVYKLSKADNLTSFISMDMVLKKHPEATSYVSTLPEYAPYFIPPTVQQPVQQPQQWNQPPMQQQQQWNQPPVQQQQQWNQPPVQQQQQWNQPPVQQQQQWNQPPVQQQQQWNQPPVQQPQQWNQPPVQQTQDWNPDNLNNQQ